MISLRSKFLLPLLLTGTALVGCGKQESVIVDDAIDAMQKSCKLGDGFSCVAAANRATAVFIDVAKIDQLTKQEIIEICTVPDIGAPANEDVELAIQSMKAVRCLGEIFDKVPDDITNVKLGAGMASLSLQANLEKRANAARLGQ